MRDRHLAFLAQSWDWTAREYANVIGGYAQMLADPCLRLDEARRLEFAERIYAAQCALTERQAEFTRLITAQRID